ncbi:MAG: hypothetical protein ACI38U_03110 [Corynebacterium sp.]|uniref:hypothetical protein n=1 Tax=Corynebacterium sp. TaxID=1720 RepID=UPI003F125A98
MPVVYANFSAVDGWPTSGTMTVWSARMRPAGQSAVTKERRSVPIVDGEATVDLVPGPVEITVTGLHGEPHSLSLTIPSQDEDVYLLDLLEGEQVWEPEVVQAAQQAARESRESARKSEGSYQSAKDLYGDLSAVKDARAGAEAARSGSESARDVSVSARDVAVVQAGRAESEADRAEGEASASAGSAADAASSAGASAGSASASAESESAADGHRQAAAASATSASGSASTAGSHRAAAESAAGRSESAADASASSAQSAESDADRADGVVRDAVVEVTGVTEGHKEAAEAAAGRAASSATAAESAQGRAEQAAEQAEDIATGDLPSASGSTRGLIRMTGDLSGTGDEPRVPALALAAAGASVCVTPGGEGWGNAVAAPAQTRTGWRFDGEWLRPPSWLGVVTVTLDWCGGTSAVLRGRRSDGNASTIETVPAGTPETHRQVTAQVDLGEFPALAVAGTWSPEDLEAGCTASLLVRPVPEHPHSMEDIEGLEYELGRRAKMDDPRFSDARAPRAHRHVITDTTGLRDELDAIHAKILAKGSTHLWDGEGQWTPPEWTGPNDTVINVETGEIRSVKEVS